MNIVIIASVVVAATITIGALLAAAVFHLSNAVRKEQNAIEMEKNRYNPPMTMGHDITVDADPDTQLQEARKLAARQAASTPRGANVRIGQVGSEKQPTAYEGLNNDPVTAVKIAQYHTWQGVVTGPSATETGSKPVLAPAQTAPPAKSADQLVPGEDYPFIEITDDMAPAEIRKARIANAKAKSAAMKALKTAAPAATLPETPAVEVSAAAPEQPAQPTVVASEPVAGVDYVVIEITKDMDPADVRKARITNAKAKSAAMKAFKEAGGGMTATPPAVEDTEKPQTETAAQLPEEANATLDVPPSIPQPEFVEISEDMSPDDIRQARIHNAKARSAYIKALKAAGIDPSGVEI